ncbi:MAG: hypothetical protein QXJ17_04635 [Nitrososphaeria archaeon]
MEFQEAYHEALTDSLSEGEALWSCSSDCFSTEGIETVLVERYGFIGGMFTGGNMAILEVASMRNFLSTASKGNIGIIT